MQWHVATVMAGCLVGGVMAGAQSSSLPSTPLTRVDYGRVKTRWVIS